MRLKLIIVIMLTIILSNNIYANDLTDKEIVNYAKEYLTDISQKFGGNSQTNFYEIECIPDYKNSKKDINFYNVSGKVSNLGINERVLSGRFNFKMAISPDENIFGFENEKYRLNKDNTEKINIIVDDKLSEELKEALAKHYIKLNYNNAIDINIVNSESDIYSSDKISVDTYVTSITDGYILYLKVTFVPTEPIQEEFDDLVITSSQWITKSTKVISKNKFPDDKKIQDDLKEILYKRFKGEYIKVNGDKKIFKITSGVAEIYNKKLIKAKGNKIKLELDLKYKLGVLFGYNSYRARSNVTYKFNIAQKEWELIKEEVELLNYNAI
ncbi:hypothetical protein SAMN06265827_12838 [Orenia metallireducens]|uniref:Outer membrane lipoprotein-sorting protein n=1 Tax=Orenia metallireducens TaxID=1413210 RepID=A0A285I072_9FIRM|nr:hypothetical protein [Orenia metallireducens]SNY41365.1 hypothetical protein SAMN06265827_12838 [Orenia metallireducens]